MTGSHSTGSLLRLGVVLLTDAASAGMGLTLTDDEASELDLGSRMELLQVRSRSSTKIVR